MRELILQEIIELSSGADTHPTSTQLPGITLIKGDVPPHQLSAIYEPMIGFTVQGRKTISIGTQTINAIAPSYYIIPTHIPAIGKVFQGKNGLPYISIGLRLNMELLQELLRDLSPNQIDEIPDEYCGEFDACIITDEIMDALLRLLRLTKKINDVHVLGSIYEREILYLILQGQLGWQLRQLCFKDGSIRKIHETIQWINENYDKNIEIKPLSKNAGMAPTTFHRQFKQITGLSPVQYQKHIRLLEARKLLVFNDYRASDAAFKVGYESPSQFNREYVRHFGFSPIQDAQRIRQLEVN
jgi:AraC-like DNA-binding protein